MTDPSTKAEVPRLARILAVDDEEPLRRNLARVLESRGYVCDVASDVSQAQEKLDSGHFELMLTDMNMIGETGLDLIVHARARHPDLAIIMITGIDDPDFAEMALRYGAYGYIIKPFQPSEILIAVSNALRRRALELESRAYTQDLELAVQDRTAELTAAIRRLESTEADLRQSREETIDRLAKAAEYRDDDAVGHIHRVSRICALLAGRLGYSPEECDTLRMSSLMHDVGKIGIPDEVLFKPGALSSEEFDLIKRHPTIGHRILDGSSSELLNTAATIALTHHERVDGTGYPQGLKGQDIPEVGRITAVADVFDALTTDRVYRPAFSVETTIEMMRGGLGTQFDAAILQLFFESLDEVLEIKKDLTRSTRV